MVVLMSVTLVLLMVCLPGQLCQLPYITEINYLVYSGTWQKW